MPSWRRNRTNIDSNGVWSAFELCEWCESAYEYTSPEGYAVCSVVNVPSVRLPAIPPLTGPPSLPSFNIVVPPLDMNNYASLDNVGTSDMVLSIEEIKKISAYLLTDSVVPPKKVEPEKGYIESRFNNLEFDD